MQTKLNNAVNTCVDPVGILLLRFRLVQNQPKWKIRQSTTEQITRMHKFSMHSSTSFERITSDNRWTGALPRRQSICSQLRGVWPEREQLIREPRKIHTKLLRDHRETERERAIRLSHVSALPLCVQTFVCVEGAEAKNPVSFQVEGHLY